MNDRVALVGLDIAKSVFQVHAADENGGILFRKRLRRDQVEPFFRDLRPCQVGLEACPGSHYWARLIRSHGHEAKLLPAQFVRPYAKSNKNDAADAEAICEAMTRPTMRFVPIKHEKQQEVLVIHRVREMLIRQRTQIINAIRGHLAEFGIVGPNRARNIGLLTVLIEDEKDRRLPPVARHALRFLVTQLRETKTKLEQIDTELVSLASQIDECRRLMSIPGVGVVTSTALVASMRDPQDFKSGRHFAAWLGLARLRDRRPANVATVAVANKTARVVWALLRYGGTYENPRRQAA